MARPRLRTSELKSIVLQCAIDALETGGPAAVRARSIAASARTSTAALYELFGDKAGLVRAIYFEGFAELRRTLEAVDQTAEPRARLTAVLAASRGFALERPLLFDVMYSRPFAEFAPDASESEDASAVYRLIVSAVRQWLADTGSSVSAREAAHIVVAAHRGFVMTELAGIAGSTRTTIESRYRKGIDAVLTGLSAEGTK